MNEFRLHIDILMGEDEDIAITQTKYLIEDLFSKAQREIMKTHLIFVINYSLSCDGDRNKKRNYLEINEEGHVSNKKTRKIM